MVSDANERLTEIVWAIQKSMEKNVLVKFSPNYISLDDCHISLNQKPKIAVLFMALCQKSQVSTSELMDIVYPPSMHGSKRMQDSCHHNLIKLISRARKFLAQETMVKGRLQSLDWIYYDQNSKSWSLYRTKVNYFNSQTSFSKEVVKNAVDLWTLQNRKWVQYFFSQQPKLALIKS